MPSACARALRFCALLALPGSVFAQSTKGRTIFAPSAQVGTITLRAAVVLPDYSVKPLPLLRVVAQRTDRADSVASETDLDGRLSMSLNPGTYTLRAKTAHPVAGRSYGWAVRVVVRPQRTEQVQLTNSNASTADSVATVVAAAPARAPAPAAVAPAQSAPARSVTQKPAQSAKPAPTTTLTSSTAAEPTPFTPPTKAIASSAPTTRRVFSEARPRTNTTGLMLGLAFDASSIRSDDLNSATESGPGLGGTIGWGFTKNFAMVLDASAAHISSLDGDYDLGHVDVGGRWHFVNRSGFVPFVEIGYSGRAAVKQDAILADGNGNTYTGDLSIMGSGVSGGAGFQYFATRSFALGGSFKWTGGQFTRVQFDKVSVDGLQVDATSARFNMGFTWFPMQGR